MSQYFIKVRSCDTNQEPEWWSRQIVSAGQSNLFYNLGNVGLGVPNPLGKLHIDGNCGIGTAYSLIAPPIDGLIVSGNVGIGTANPTSTLHVNGTIKATSFDGNILTGTVATLRGGTGASLTPVLGGIIHGASGTTMACTAVGTAGEALVSNAGAAPTWQTLTLENVPDAAFKRSVMAATTANLTATAATLTLTGPSGASAVVFPAQDGITLVLNDRILVKNQTTAAQNGIYRLSTVGVAATTAWVLTRVADADTISEVGGSIVNVDKGTAQGGQLWTTSFKLTDTLGTTSMNWYKVLDTSLVTGSGNVVFQTTPTLTTPVLGVATGTSLAVTGAITSSGGGIGYATGAGGAVTQITSRTTAVTLSKLTGQITRYSQQLLQQTPPKLLL